MDMPELTRLQLEYVIDEKDPTTTSPTASVIPAGQIWPSWIALLAWWFVFALLFALAL